MAKKPREPETEGQRQSRKDVLRERRVARQARQVRILVGVVLGIVLLVILIAVINEFVIGPSRAVATVNDTTITLREWRDRVRYQRAQFIIGIEDQFEAFNDLALVQQFSGQQIQLLQEGEELGRLVLEQMVDEAIVEQEARARGIVVTEEEVDEFLAESFNFFGGDSPTPFPTPTATIMPTPSLTPIPSGVITEVVPSPTPLATATAGPTVTPLPTPTPVSQEAFDEELTTLLERYQGFGVSEATFRSALEARLYRERLIDALAEEEEVATDAEMASVFVLSFATEAEAEEALDRIQDEEFLTVWNTIRSTPPDPEAEDPPAATELLWRTEEQLAGTYSPEIAETIFEVPLNTPTEVIQLPARAEGEPERFYIFMVSGREERPLSEGVIEAAEAQLLTALIETVRNSDTANVALTQLWRNRVPRVPVLDPSFLAPIPTPEATEAPPITISTATPAAPADE